MCHTEHIIHIWMLTPVLWGLSIRKCLTEHIVMILMLIDFAYHAITGQVQKYYL